jgi:hypothetical protein
MGTYNEQRTRQQEERKEETATHRKRKESCEEDKKSRNQRIRQLSKTDHRITAVVLMTCLCAIGTNHRCLQS